MVRKLPDKQWNRQNSILFHETIPLKGQMRQQIGVIAYNSKRISQDLMGKSGTQDGCFNEKYLGSKNCPYKKLL
jgi:hypothetical protein